MTKKDRDEVLELINTLVLDIENEKSALSQILIKAKRVYTRTNTKELGEFITHELEGDYQDENLPPYRRRRSEPFGVLRNQYTGRIEHLPLNYGPLLKTTGVDPDSIYIRSLPFSIPEIEDYLKKTELEDLMIEFTDEQLNFVRQYLEQDQLNGWQLKSAYFKFPFSTFTHILSLTRNELVNILLKIQAVLNRSTELDNENFFEDGKHFDAVVQLSNTISQATNEIIIIDNYVDEKTLQLISNKKPDVEVKILTSPKSNNARLQVFVNSFNSQYENLLVKSTAVFHDRFLVIDRSLFYHIGASIKDAGKKTFMYSKIEDEFIQQAVLEKFVAEWEK